MAPVHGLARLLDLFKRNYARANCNVTPVPHSLTYFVDAEKKPMPDMRASISWIRRLSSSAGKHRS